MRVSVVIVAKHAERAIRHVVESVLRQTIKPYEIIVVVDSLGDPTVEAVEDLSVKVILNEGVGLGAARKTGVDASAGDIIAVIDADCIADKRWIEGLVEAFSKSNVVVQEGRVISVKALPDIPTTSPKLSSENSRFLNFALTLNSNVAFRKELVNIIGNFDPWFEKGGEDLDFCIRLRKAGYGIHDNPNAKVYHLAHRFTMRRAWRDGRSRAQALIKHGTTMLADTFIILLHAISLLASLTLLAIGYPKLAFLVFIPSLMHKLYRTFINVKQGNTVLASLLNSLTTYISYISFIISFPNFALKRRMRKIRIKQVNEKLSTVYERTFPFSYTNILLRLIGNANTLLDVGCGEGKAWGALKQRVGSVYSVGLDLYLPYIKAAKDYKTHEDFVFVDVRHLPFRKNSFDVVICLEVVEHLPKYNGVSLLRELSHIAKNKVVISTPNYFFHVPPPRNSQIHHGHVSLYSQKELRKMGFKIWSLRVKAVAGKTGIVASILRFTLAPLTYFLPLFGTCTIGVKHCVPRLRRLAKPKV